MQRRHTRGLPAAAAIAGVSLLLSACGGAAEGGSSEPPARDSADSGERLAVSYENGVAVLDGKSLEIIDEFESEEFTRLNAVGDGRSVLVTVSKGFQVLDAETPELTDTIIPADAAGHVVRHAGKTVLYADGTGETTVLASDALLDSDGKLPKTEVIPAKSAHHGVSIVLEDGTLLTTIGTEDSRSGVRAVDKDGKEVARNEKCPEVHGEGTAADEAVIFGCENGALLYHHGKFEKFTAPDKVGRMGNAYVSETSPIIVGDYKDDPDAEGYLLDMVTLIDTEKHTYEAIELPEGIEYTWRGVVRGPDDLAYILSTDGAIHVLDPATGKVTEKHPVIAPWEGPAEWQNPHPAMTVHGETAYVAEPATKKVHAVDLTTGKITASAEFTEEPNEMAPVLD